MSALEVPAWIKSSSKLLLTLSERGDLITPKVHRRNEMKKKPKIRCPHCGSSQAYIRIKSHQIVCPECGEVSEQKAQIEAIIQKAKGVPE